MRSSFALMCVASCAGPSPGPHATTLQAPAAARWSSATVITHYDQERVRSSWLGTVRTYDVVDVELVVRIGDLGQSMPLVTDTMNVLGLELRPRELATREFELAASPDGTWLAVSGDRGARWTLVDPTTLVVCRHLGLQGPPDRFWRRTPQPEVLARDIAASSLGARGPLGHDHGDERATPWVLAHADRPDVLLLLVDLLLAQADNELDTSLFDAVRAAAPTSEAVRERLHRGFDTVHAGHMAAGGRIAELVWDASPTVELAAWIDRAAAAGGPTIFDAALPMSDWAFARAVWDLARLVDRDRHVPPDAERAAIAVIEHVARLPANPDEDRDAMRRATANSPWPVVRFPAARAAVTYAIQILAAAHTPTARRAIEGMRFDRSGPTPQLAVHYQDPKTDYLAGDVDAWFRWSLSRR